MATYKFYQDKKIEIWERTHFTVNADTEAEAKNIIENQNGNDTDHMTGIVVGASEMLFETSKNISMNDNAGFATLEIYIDNGDKDNLISCNGLDIEDR